MHVDDVAKKGVHAHGCAQKITCTWCGQKITCTWACIHHAKGTLPSNSLLGLRIEKEF